VTLPLILRTTFFVTTTDLKRYRRNLKSANVKLNVGEML
jgi:hypothetical protein